MQPDQPAPSCTTRLENLAWRIAALAALAGAALLWVRHLQAFWRFTTDDSFITFRYAANLIGGHGPTYNPGGPPIEGYTTFLWMLISALPQALGIDVVGFAKWFGLAATLGVLAITFVLAMQWARALPPAPRTLVAGLAVLALAAFGPTAWHAVAGMETHLFTLLLLGFAALLTYYLEDAAQRSPLPAAITALLLGLTRPEGNLAALAGFGAALLLAPPEARPRLLRTVGLVYGLPGAVYFTWRTLYYGLALPLPFYLKVADQGALAGWPELRAFLRLWMPPLCVPLLAGVLRLRRSAIPAALGVLALLTFFAFPAHIMGYGWRYLTPSLPILLALSAAGVGQIAAWAGARSSVLQPATLIVGTGLGVLLALGLHTRAGPEANGATWYAYSLENAQIALGRRLAAFAGPEAGLVLAIPDAGAAPYYSGWVTVDTGGLNDPQIALSGEHSPDYILGQGVDVLVVNSHDKESFEAVEPWEADLYAAALAQGMAPVKVINFNYYFLWVLADPASPVGAYLSAP